MYLSPERSASVSVVQLIRKYFRVPEEDEGEGGREGGVWEEEEVEEEGGMEGGKEGGRDRLDAAFLGLRELSKAWHAVEVNVLPLLGGKGGGEGGKEGEEERCSSGSSSSSSSSSSFDGVKFAESLGPGVILLARPMMVCTLPSLPPSLPPLMKFIVPSLPPSPPSSGPRHFSKSRHLSHRALKARGSLRSDSQKQESSRC